MAKCVVLDPYPDNDFHIRVLYGTGAFLELDTDMQSFSIFLSGASAFRRLDPDQSNLQLDPRPTISAMDRLQDDVLVSFVPELCKGSLPIIQI